jgi:hypothetical protein
MLPDTRTPRYLPHLHNPEVLQMGLSPLGEAAWIETDDGLGNFHRHKLRQRERYGDRVCRATAASLPARRELAAALLAHLRDDQGDYYRVEGDALVCPFAGIRTPLESDEPLWNCSLWVADDLVIMEEGRDGYRLTAASLCSPSHWRLEEKFNRPLREIHDPIPGFHRALTPRIDRLFNHLRPEHPVVRYNWAVQAGDRLNERMEAPQEILADSPLYYRTERQSLMRLPRSTAIAFTIRVYLHPLERLAEFEGALPALFAAIDNTPPALGAYKGFDRLEVALARYRQRYR